jgi:L-ascorbate metabolism protein UlaG (beta-lactamase superfamily)
MHAAIRYALAACVVAIVSCFSDSAAAAAQGKIELQWFGQSAFRITTVNGKVIVIEPWLTENPMTPQEYKNLDAIGKMDILLVTHAHADHLGDGPELAKKYNAPLWGPAGLADSL